jgi:hypothetical protein
VFLKRKLVIALIVCLALAQACRYHNDLAPDLTLTHEVSPEPPRVGPSTITLKVADAAGKPMSGLRIKLEGNMSHAGMSPVLTAARETGPGQYSSTIELTMAGDWYFLVHMIFPDGRKLDRQFEIKGVVQP